MKRKRSSAGNQGLRRTAEQHPGHSPAKEVAPSGELFRANDARELKQELEVHRVELEMQNEELRAARIAIEAGLARYTAIFDFAPLGYAVLTPDDAIREINHAGAHLLGRNRSRLLGARLAGYVAEHDRPRFDDVITRARTTGQKEGAELTFQDSEGRDVFCAVSAIEMADPEPTTLVVFEDVSERRARQEQLERTQLALREADRRKDDFLASLSHELRNPLGPIRTSLFLLDNVRSGEEQARRARTIIDRQVTHLSRLVNDLLDATRIARGKIQLRSARLDLAELVRATLEDHRSSFETAGIGLETRLESSPLWVDGDSDRLIQSVSNVLANAEKFTPRGGTVLVTLERAGAEASLRIRDTGSGISPETLAHVFEPFAQGPQTLDRRRGGLGLGLAMVKGFVELHGGRVSISSRGIGLGAELVMRLPLAEDAAAEKPGASAPAASAHHTRRVLLIEDNTDAADSLADALEIHGHDVRVAYDGQSAIDLAHGFRPEVVICDIGLPLMNGYVVAQTFRGDDALKAAYLIALSGYARPEDLERAREAGFDQHLTKPPVIDELDRLISGT